MEDKEINNITLEILRKYNLKLNKSLGQNFLIDQNITGKIVDGAEISKDDIVVEVGPGIGSLTRVIAERAERVIAVEIDKNVIEPLEEALMGYDNVEVINEDILKADIKKLFDFGDRKIKVVANLPYYITTPIIMRFFEENINVESLTLMVQKEVADRIVSVPGKKDYGILSVAVQFYSRAKKLFDVPKGCFVPQPDVISAVIRLDVLEKAAIDTDDKEHFFKVVKASFGQRRKTLVNALCNSGIGKGMTKEDIRNIIVAMELSENVRAEELSIEQFGELAKKI